MQRLFDDFRILKALIILLLSFVCLCYVPNQNEKILEEALPGSNSDIAKTTLRQRLRDFKMNFPIVTYNREYYKWIYRLRRHIQVGSLSIQGTWLGLVTQSVIWGSMWPTCQKNNNSVKNIRWWRFPFPSSPSFALAHLNSRLETNFVLLAKIIESAVFQMSLPHWFVFTETV